MNEFRYPQASRLDLTEDIGGHQVSDPYRWMEDDTSAERAGWLVSFTRYGTWAVAALFTGDS